MWNFSRFSRYTDLALAAALTAAGIYFFSGYFTPVRFDRERIEVEVTRGQVHVKGLYHYANSSRLPAVLTLLVPFPVDPDHPDPKWFALCHSSEYGRGGEEIVPGVRGGNVSFRLFFGPKEAKWVRLDYVQQTRVGSGRYLLTTTRAWGRPISRANFILHLPEDLNLVSSSYPLQESAAESSEKSFTFSRTDFFPEKDWTFSWADVSAELAKSEEGQP